MAGLLAPPAPDLVAPTAHRAHDGVAPTAPCLESSLAPPAPCPQDGVAPAEPRSPDGPAPSGRRAGRRARAWVCDAGMATAEYAIVTLAAVGFAGLLLAILKSGEVRALLMGLIRAALQA